MKPWLWPNLLSLDAPLLALLWQHMVAGELSISLSRASRAALPLAVWVIYLSDRLLDTVRTPGPQTVRHGFYWKCRFGCVALLLTATVLLLATLEFLPLPVLRNGLFVLSLVGAYLLTVHLLPDSAGKWLPKELAVAVIFSAGTLVAPLTWLANPWPLTATALLFTALCWINCAAIEIWEWQRLGNTSGRPHFASVWLVKHINTAALCVGISALTLAPFSACPFSLVSIATGGFAFVLLSKGQSTIALDTLRVLADLPLLAPILLLGRY